MKDAKARSGFSHARLRGQRLWQDGYYDRVLRHDEATLDVARYVLENPVRAGFVAAIEQYPFLGSGEYPLEHLIEMLQMGRDTGRSR